MVIQPGGTSVGGTAGTSSSAQIAIPPLSNGDNPKWVHIAIVADAVGAVFVFGQEDAVPTATMANGVGVPSYHCELVVNVAGNSHYKTIAISASTHYTMTPLAGIVAGG